MKWSRSIAFALPLRAVLAVPAFSNGTGNGSGPGTGTASASALPDPAEAAIRQREDQAFERGLAEGERRLGELMVRQRTDVQQLQIGVIDSLRQAVANLLRDTEAALIDLAFEVAQKIVAEVPLDAAMVATNVRTALAAAREASELAVHLHPDDLDLLRRVTPETLEPPSGTGNGTVRWIAAPDVGRGGCLVRSELGTIDARRESRLTRLRQAVEP